MSTQTPSATGTTRLRRLWKEPRCRQAAPRAPHGVCSGYRPALNQPARDGVPGNHRPVLPTNLHVGGAQWAAGPCSSWCHWVAGSHPETLPLTARGFVLGWGLGGAWSPCTWLLRGPCFLSARWLLPGQVPWAHEPGGSCMAVPDLSSRVVEPQPRVTGQAAEPPSHGEWRRSRRRVARGLVDIRGAYELPLGLAVATPLGSFQVPAGTHQLQGHAPRGQSVAC